MALLGKLLQKGISLREGLEQKYSWPPDLQKEQLRRLLISARETAFGQHYGFDAILAAFRSPDPLSYYPAFRRSVPIFDYNRINAGWWHRTRQGERDVCWPGKVRYFAMSSGTSGESSKYIPVTKEMIKAIRKTSVRQLLTLSRYDLPPELFEKGILMLGGSTALRKAESYYEGDLSGISAGKIPFWFQHFYKPGKKISKNTNWQRKLEEITLAARDWDIGVVVGVPAWIQLMLEKIVAHYRVASIHDIWPNLRIYVHGGVAFEPYRRSFEKLLARPLEYIETYLASEGFIAYQAMPGRRSMRLVLNNGLFYEFIPFNERNFDAEGNLRDDATACSIGEVEEGVDYAILLSTCAGAWRYLIGDVVKFTSVFDCELQITGRTRHFLSLCGEHMSLDNMNQAVRLTEEELDIAVREFTVAGIPEGSLFAHQWYLGCEGNVDAGEVARCLDRHLGALNDDYRIEREYALKRIYVRILPPDAFYDWMRARGREGGQNKFPRVLRNERLGEWQKFIHNRYPD
jgi:hypothetical protein